MKNFPILIAMFYAASALAQTNIPIDNFVLVTNLWYNGNKTNVLAIADQRLTANTNDLAGLFLKFEYDLSFSNNEFLSNDIYRIVNSLHRLPNADPMTNDVAAIVDDLEDFLHFLCEDYHPTFEALLQEKEQALIIHKPMSNTKYLKWLHDNGLF